MNITLKIWFNNKKNSRIYYMSNIAENMTTMNAIIESSAIDLGKLQNKKIKTSGQKLRANLLSIKKLCDTTRKQVLEEMKAIPTKKRSKTTTPPNIPEDKPLTEREVMEALNEIEKPKPKTKAKAKK